MTVEYCCRITLFTLPKAVQQQFQGEVGNYNFLVLRLLMDVVYQKLLRSVIFHRVLSLSLSFSLSFIAIFPGLLGLVGSRMSQFWSLLEPRMTEVVATELFIKLKRVFSTICRSAKFGNWLLKQMS